MHRIMVLVVLFVFTFISSGYSGNFKVRSAKENPREAVLVDEDTGSEWLVREGDRFDGSIVREIRRSHISVATPLDAHRCIVTKIPVSR